MVSIFGNAKIFQLVIVATVFGLYAPSCSKKGKSRANGGPVGQTETPVEPTPDLPPGDPSVGEEVPPINNEEVTVLETGDEIALKHLRFTASDTTEDFRYLSEYLLVVRSSKASCIKIKVRPTGGLVEDAPEDDKAENTKNCDTSENTQTTEEAATPEDQPADPAAAGEAAALRLKEQITRVSPHSLVKELDVEFTPTLKQKTFALTNSPSLCSKRLFRMFADDPTLVGDPSGLDKVITKTARLTQVSSGGKVRIWVDEEFGNPCRGGSTAADFRAVGFGYLNRLFSVNYLDKLYLEHLSNLAEATEKSLNELTSTYGDVSDVDSSGTVDVFISPEVNRKYFFNKESSYFDTFEVDLIDRPKDLSYFNAATNPSSNEGEIIYMWAPDPGGIYQYLQFPTANSLSSNYAKGFAAAQIMNLINNNSHLILQKGEEESEFLKQSFALLASGYFGGIDYAKFFLAHYMTTWHQGLSLDLGPDAEILGNDYEFTKNDMYGMRAMFGWYLHTRLCGRDTVEPCADLKALIDTEKVGIENLEEILGEDMGAILEHFGASVGVSLLDDPVAALALWDQEGILSTKPVQLPDLQEVSAASPPETFEANTTATGERTPRTDRTFAGPFPSKKMLIFQPILPDEELSLTLAQNSVTYILLTGLIEQETDATAVLGPNLNVQIVPAGDRNSGMRRIHKEKQSELGHLDLRPVNLTKQVDSQYTYYEPSEYEDSLDYSVSLEREIWIMGSVDKYNVYMADGVKDVGDVDSYNITINPCLSLNGAALTACEGQVHHVLVQTYIRDLPKKLDPMLLVTAPSLNIFSGQSMWGLVRDLDTEFVYDEEDDTQIGVFCQMEVGASTLAEKRRCANGGLTASDFQTDVCTQFASLGACLNGIPDQAVSFNFYNKILGFGYEAPYDNFFHSTMGFPYYNNGTMSYQDVAIRENPRAFIDEEFKRQFLYFGYAKDLDPYTFHYYTIDAATTIPSGSFNVMDFETINGLITIRDKIEANSPPADDIFKETCMGLGFTEASCTNLGASLNAEVIAWIAENNAIIICREDPACPGSVFTQAGAVASAWLTPGVSFFVYFTAKDSLGTGSPISYTSYYKPVLPKAMHGYCAGEPGGTPVSLCPVKESFLLASEDNDIRRQLNVPKSKYDIGYCGTIVEDADVCADYLSYHYEMTDDRPGASWASITLPTDRVREIPTFLYTKAGEIIAKPQRIHNVTVDVKGSQETIIHIIVGGRQLSQGKYLLRARIIPD